MSVLCALRQGGRKRNRVHRADAAGSRKSDPEGRSGNHRGVLGRTGDGGGRRADATRRLLGGGSSHPQQIRHPVGGRRGDLRIWPHRQDVRLRDVQHQAGCAGGVETDHLILYAAVGDPHERPLLSADRRRIQPHRLIRPRLHCVWSSSRDGGRSGKSEDHSGARSGRPCRGPARYFSVGTGGACQTPRRAFIARHRPDRRIGDQAVDGCQARRCCARRCRRRPRSWRDYTQHR